MNAVARTLAVVALAAATACTAILGATDVPNQEDGGADATMLGDAGADAPSADARSPGDAPNWACTPDSARCNGLQPQPCNSAGQWADAGAACPYLCTAGVCTGVCTPSSMGCSGLQAQSCNDAGRWVDGMLCTQLCNSGSCTACTPGSDRCNALQPQACNDAGLWANNGGACACGCSAGACAVSYVAEVLCDHPLAYWRLDEASGAAAADQIGAYPGNYNGDVKYGQPGAIQGDPDTCIELNSTGAMSGYVGLSQSLSSMLEFNGQGGQAPFSIEAWIQPTSITSEYRGVLSNEYGAGAKQGYVIYVGGFTSNGTGIGFERFQDGNSTPLQDPSVVTQNSGWYHVVGVYDGSQMILYVNGQAVVSKASSIAIQSFTCTFNIGATHCGATGTNFQGFVDEVAVYGTALSQARVQAHYQAAQ